MFNDAAKDPQTRSLTLKFAETKFLQLLQTFYPLAQNRND